MAITIGPKPLEVSWKLYADADLVFSLKETDEVNFPAESSLTLTFYSSTSEIESYVAVIDGFSALFNIDKLEVNSLISEGVNRAKVFYDDGSGLETILLLGRVSYVE